MDWIPVAISVVHCCISGCSSMCTYDAENGSGWLEVKIDVEVEVVVACS